MTHHFILIFHNPSLSIQGRLGDGTREPEIPLQSRAVLVNSCVKEEIGIDLDYSAKSW